MRNASIQNLKRALRLSVVALCMLAGVTTEALAQKVNLSKQITVEFKDEPLTAALKKVEKLAETEILFTYEDLQSYSVTKKFENVPVGDVLSQLLEGKALNYVITGKSITIITKANQAANSKKEKMTASGYVTDLAGVALPNVAVKLRGTDRGTLTGKNGVFTLADVARGDVLVFSMTGMETTEVAFSGQPSIHVEMDMAIDALEATVITGIFNKSRESYTGSVTSVTSQDLNLYRGQNVVATLRNFDPALNIVYSNVSGSNPNALPTFDIRGSSSLPTSLEELNEGVNSSVNTPLIIMDGFEISLSRLMDFNSEEIQSINILKDASATAIYGSRGANGVVVITSKAPQPGQLRVNFQMGLNIEVPDLSSYNLCNAAEKLEIEKRAGIYSYDDDPILKYRYNNFYAETLRDVLSGYDTDWLSQPLRTGVGQKYNLRLEGGSKEFRWGVTGQYNDISGAMKGSSRRTFTGSVILSYTYKNLLFRNQTNVALNNSSESKYGDFSDYAVMEPYWRIHDDNGKLIKEYSHNGLLFYNPLYDAQLNTIDTSEYTEIINNFSIDWNITKHLTARAQLGLSKNLGRTDYFLPAEHSTFSSSTYSTTDGYFRKGQYDYGNSTSVSIDGNATLSYSNTFAEKHQLYAGFNYSIYDYSSENLMFKAEGFSSANLSFIGNALQYAQNSTPYGSESRTRRVGFTGNVNYTYDNRYYVDLSLRTDGSSQFGSKNKFAPFWSAGLGWNIHNEPFMKDQDVVNNLRLKASFGETGSQQFSAYQALQTFKYFTDNKYLMWNGASLMALGNENLKWQVTDQINLGAEVGLWNNRVTATFDYYQKWTSNLLSSMDIPGATGFTSYVENIGEVKNTGYEAGLSVYPIQNPKRGINWMVSAKLSYNKNEITKLSDAIKAQNEQYLLQDVDVANLFYEGRSQNGIYAVRSLGIDPATGQEFFLDKDDNITTTWNASDKVYLGVGDQPYRATISSMLSVGNFIFNLSFASHWGGLIYNSTLLNKVELASYQIARQNVDRRVLSDRWSQPGDNTFFKGYTESTTRATSRFVMEDRTMELQSASVQYKYGSPSLKKMGLETVTIGVNTSDLVYISTIRRERGTSYPFARRVNLTLSLLF
ncbi:MAG: SusC/RagA family TonB-linked outer membrane protein [Bacteroidales bacterium]|nr:SusC/RagA family TonB-linked outer membrane protein [Bacteroidales bacterium]